MPFFSTQTPYVSSSIVHSYLKSISFFSIMDISTSSPENRSDADVSFVFSNTYSNYLSVSFIFDSLLPALKKNNNLNSMGKRRGNSNCKWNLFKVLSLSFSFCTRWRFSTLFGLSLFWLASYLPTPEVVVSCHVLAA